MAYLGHIFPRLPTPFAILDVVVIRTNGGTLTVNALSDTVKHYGIANKVDIQAVASTSYIENGIVSIAKIKTGRIVVTQEAVLTSIHVVETNGNYNNIKVAVVANAELPSFTRDDVAMNDGDKKLVIEVQSIPTLTSTDDSPEYIWVSKAGEVVSTDIANSAAELNEGTKIPVSSQSAAAKTVAQETTEGTTADELAEMETIATRYAGGQGTESNPYLLATKDHFGSIDEDYHNGVTAGKYYKLVTDLDLGKIYPIGSLSLSGNNGTSSQGYSVIGGEAFEGHFDGNNHSVTYQMVADDGLGSTSTFGLFGAINNCSIKNLTINADLQCDRASIWVGGLAGFALGNCIFENITMNGNIVGSWDIGGFIGATDDFGTGYFLNCVNNANVTTNNKRTGTNYAIAGGFIGQGNFKNNGTLTFSNCENNGIITVNKANNADLSATASHFIGFISDSQYGTYVLNDCTIGKDASVVSTIGYTRTVGTKTIYCVYTTESETIVPSIKYIGITNQTWTGATTGLNSRVLINGVQQDTSLYVSASN